MAQLTELPQRSVGEWSLRSSYEYDNPFADVRVDAEFSSPENETFHIPGFHDGDNVWRVRFNPAIPGRWTYRLTAFPADPGLSVEGEFTVTPAPTRGFLRATPGQAWGFHYENGDPALLLGDTVYNLLAETYLGHDIRPFLHRRASQGFNLLRMSAVPLPFCPPNAYAKWADHRIWPWGGSEWYPLLDRFDVRYFRAVDEAVRLVDEAGLGVEMIMQFPARNGPFNRRDLFTAESEELWTRYLVARYDAFASVYFWTLANEYEYLNNEFRWTHTHDANRWALRMARQVKSLAAHGHPVTVHSGPERPPFVWRFAADPDAVDVVMYQAWGTIGADDGWLAAGIEEAITGALAGWPGSAVFSEYGYESTPELAHVMPGHRYCDVEHTRRGAWRAAMQGLGVVHGFHETWWGFGDYGKDQEGVVALGHLQRFFTEVVRFDGLSPSHSVVAKGPTDAGHTPSALASADGRTAVVYLPTGGETTLRVPASAHARWYDPRTGDLADGLLEAAGDGSRVKSPGGESGTGHPHDWVLLVEG